MDAAIPQPQDAAEPSDPAIHIWWAHEMASPVDVWRLFQTLSDDERQRSMQTKTSSAFRHFVCARGTLREILSQYTGVSPKHLNIAQGRGGKPYLHDLPDDGLRFNLAHAGDYAVYAISWGSDIGVDLEQIAPRHADPQLWPHALSAREIDTLNTVPEEARPETVARLWTRKEAVLKATGRGLAYPISSLELSRNPESGDSVAQLDGFWHVIDLPEPEAGLVAAVATRAAHPALLIRTVPVSRGWTIE